MNQQGFMPLLSKLEISQIFNDGHLLELGSFHVIDKVTKTYDINRKRGSFLEEAAFIRTAYQDGHTIIVKNLEHYNEQIRRQSVNLGRDVSVHLYLVPPKGSDSFDFHIDDTDVWLKMLYGEKKVFCKTASGVEEHHLKSEDELFIKKGVFHKAEPMGASCMLSFGYNGKVFYQVSGGITLEDLAPTPVDV
jgi:hypothetical protein